MSNIKVRGTVCDAFDKEPLVGAAVVVDRTINGTVTDADGFYVIDNVRNGSQIRASYVGYFSNKKKAEPTLNFALYSDSDFLLLLLDVATLII